jgi:hypothetical protein
MYIGIDRRGAGRGESIETIRFAGGDAAGDAATRRGPDGAHEAKVTAAGISASWIRRRRDPFFDERVPFVASAALPEQFRACG